MDRITIEGGMQDISSGTCIKFIPRTHEPNFLDIQPRYGWVQLIHTPFRWLWVVSWSFSVCVCVLLSCFLFIFFVALSKLLVISGPDRRKSDPVPADPRVHVVRSGCARANARPGLCARAVPLWPRQLCDDCVEEHHGRWGGMTRSAMLWRILETYLLHFLWF